MTPMQKQYQDIKSQHPEDIVLFRLGDFYEAFEDDAKTLNKVIGLTLTGRGKGENRIPMAGIPHHALDNYLPDIIKAGYKVVMVDQLSDPRPGELVERGVTHIYSAGTLTDENTLPQDSNNYIACVFANKQKAEYGVAVADISAGKLFTFILADSQNLIAELNRLQPAEVVVPRGFPLREILQKFNISFLTDEDFDIKSSYDLLLKQLEVKNLKGFGIEDDQSSIASLGGLLTYLYETQRTELKHLKQVTKRSTSQFMPLDLQTIQNLELLYPLVGNNRSATVFNVIDVTSTAMGKRKLRDWLLHPLLNKGALIERWDSVEFLHNNSILLTDIREELEAVVDIERILGRIGIGSANARELQALRSGLIMIKGAINNFDDQQAYPEFLSQRITAIRESELVNKVIDIITTNIEPDPPVTITDGDIILPSANEHVAALKKLSRGGKEELAEIQARESESTKIPSLKIGFNKVFGYYIEVTKTHTDKVPDSYTRKQTLSNAERYITPELKELEEQILSAQEELKQLEYELFIEIRNQVAQYSAELLLLIDKVAEIDVIAAFAHLAREYDYRRPALSDNKEFKIQAGRHPVVERLQDTFTPNDVDLSSSPLAILKGTNMSGKSTYIRQIALIALLAQIGSFVPASEFRFSIIDRIFTRVGAADNLSKGESTFMLEMTEAANILNNATENSLVILDEVGRGTSTYDGVAIAWSIAEYLRDDLKSFSLFATHYHELITLEESSRGKIQNLHVDVAELDGKVLFKHKILPGGTDKSYGVHVAELAGVPPQVVSRANDILQSFESNQTVGIEDSHIEKSETSQKQTKQTSEKLTKKNKIKKDLKTNTKPAKPKKIHPEQLGLI